MLIEEMSEFAQKLISLLIRMPKRQRPEILFDDVYEKSIKKLRPEIDAEKNAAEFWGWFSSTEMFEEYVQFLDSPSQESVRFEIDNGDLKKFDLICVKDKHAFNVAGKFLSKKLEERLISVSFYRKGSLAFDDASDVKDILYFERIYS
jgi:hypothetical protein